jgi:hypothetical protein
MTPMVATSIVPHLDRLACAYFHTSAHLIRQPGRGKVDRVGRHRSSFHRCAQKNGLIPDASYVSHRIVQVKIERIVHRCPDSRDPGTSAGYASTVDGRMFTFKPPDSSSFFNSS